VHAQGRCAPLKTRGVFGRAYRGVPGVKNFTSGVIQPV
jgi:hypothetical protein